MSRELPPSPKDDFEPSNQEIDSYIRRLEVDLTASPEGNSKDQVRGRNVEHPAEGRGYYEKARGRAAAFLPAIDPDLRVVVETADVTPDKPGALNYTTPVLRFYHGPVSSGARCQTRRRPPVPFGKSAALWRSPRYGGRGEAT